MTPKELDKYVFEKEQKLIKLVSTEMLTRGYTIELFAKEIGVSREYLFRWLTGKGDLDLKGIIGIEKVLKVKIIKFEADLLKET